MRALAVTPGEPNSACLIETPDPVNQPNVLLVQTLAIGVCGTDREILAGAYGWAPPNRTRLIIGHESVGRVLEAPENSGFSSGDLVVGIVRRPDPVPCEYCAVGEWDMCRNGRYVERGIKELDGYGSERFSLEPEFAVKIEPQLGDLAVLVEPASVVAKAWDHAYRIGSRSSAWKPRSALITGAGPIGLLAALMGRERGLDVYVFDQVLDGPKPQLVRDLGGHYFGGSIPGIDKLAPDIIIECTGATSVIADVVTRSAPSGSVCLAGVSSGGHSIKLDLGEMNRRMVLENDVIFGSVNANRSHYVAAAEALAHADRAWLSRLITRRMPLNDWAQAFEPHPQDVKVILEFKEDHEHTH
jgi:threonine dehydrogenase-like Zn-dependent dehydrogenase